MMEIFCNHNEKSTHANPVLIFCQNKNNIHKSLTEMNDIIFELFTDSLQNNFLKQLTQDELSDEYSFVMGVN